MKNILLKLCDVIGLELKARNDLILRNLISSLKIFWLAIYYTDVIIQ